MICENDGAEVRDFVRFVKNDGVGVRDIVRVVKNDGVGVRDIVRVVKTVGARGLGQAYVLAYIQLDILQASDWFKRHSNLFYYEKRIALAHLIIRCAKN